MLVALRGGVGGVVLHVPGDAVDVFEEEGDEGDVVLLREGGVHGVEFLDVVGAVVGGERDAGENDFGAVRLELRDDAGEVGLGLLEGQTAKAVIAAELDDDDLRMSGDHASDAIEAVLGGVAGDAGVDDVVTKSLGVEEALEVVGVGLAVVGAIAGGEGVAETEEEGARVGGGGRIVDGQRGRGRGRRGDRRGGLGVAACELASSDAKAGGDRRQSDKSDTG